ncbi:MAG: DUF1501 domain-containing protein [Fuerstiella sp.]|nr:DUF1501 domain-containing protein [Fuerstiella sp.]
MIRHLMCGVVMSSLCHRFRSSSSAETSVIPSRRGFLQSGVLPGLGTSLANLLSRPASATTGSPAPRAKSVIMVWLQGGVSHHDTFDMKPNAPVEIRGPFQPISTTLPGTHVCSLLPGIAQRMDRLAVLRSVTHRENAHERGTRQMLTFRQPVSPVRKPTDHPDLASVVVHELGPRAKIPPYVVLEYRGTFTSREGLYATGFLPQGDGPYYSYDWDSLMPNQVPSKRLEQRTSLRTRFNGLSSTSGRLTQLDEFRLYDRYTDEAVDLIRSNVAADAFDIDKEPQSVRDRYNAKDKASACFLIARRLIEAGVRVVTIGQSGWDHHGNIFPALTSRLPKTESAFCALLDDLEQRGLLDETLVLWMTEFGRTPQINPAVGRDHWPQVFSVALAGGGVRSGQVIGASDQIGGEVLTRPISPPEIAATLYQLLGISHQAAYVGPDRRPLLYVANDARPIAELL